MIDVITLSDPGVRVARLLAAHLPAAALHFHETVTDWKGGRLFDRSFDLIRELFPTTNGIVFIGPCGVMVRAAAPLLVDKYSDPPVVVTDVRGRYAVSLFSGHEGGANDLAVTVSNILGAEPVITTTSDAVRTVIVGIGCRRGCPAGNILEAVRSALEKNGISPDAVRFLASADIKGNEPGLLEAAAALDIPLRLIPSDEIRETSRLFQHNPIARRRVGLPAVAEPAALLAGRRTRFIQRKIIHNGVTVAIARENCL